MQPVDSNLSFLNDMLHHPLIFRLDAVSQKYVSKSTLNTGASIDSCALIFSQGRCAHIRLLATIQSNRDFLVLLVFKLLGRGIYISSRNVAIVQGDGDGGEDGSISGPATPPRAAIVLHCDVIAFHAKKRHVYPIVVCDDSTHLQECRAHALRVAHSIRCATPRHSIVFPYVLTVYDLCCSALQCVAMRCSALQCDAVCCSVMQCVAVCCSVLQCFAVCCSVMQCVAV